jgi:glc operon protein GlcG
MVKRPAPHLSHRHAARLIEAARVELERRVKGAAVAVADDRGELVAFLRTDGCPPPSLTIAQNKAFTAAREGIPTGELGTRSRQEGFPLTYFGELRYVGWGGGIPLVVDGVVVGAVAVSGLPETEDVELAKLAAEALDG